MNIFLHILDTNPKKEDNSPSHHHVPEIAQYDHDINTAEGGEFLDDALRMEEQPFYTPDNI